ncbi:MULTISPECIES: ABC transporter substrate-binding protein [Pseudothermotoga]|jgi:multiple sugar transport system substrate-binding protein|uniref:Extracellular solute-binding protein family 1 n=1 Tax=Pseudothermotoga lettingae (strain ATCC BAA-301 / DSM 14385 / NBRC 107922 / TMO) TaxID=416591 RepID=A8F3Q3_PSELT|nr:MULTISPECIES: ABC transporter substrate-binding protein [Pseudothermotoga]ABV32787.1 extracellular solute-binding protein family 1 [Pseudothermotoga lettingae TMO]MDI3495042.1 multiple sugar transport system substrate-binding protein [Pseudothermotoga sp.]GLI48218.1 sugar ABC transporter substrate-binding protein [Pseudothermotoga lettingae TMO]
MKKSLLIVLISIFVIITSGFAKTKIILAVHWSDYQVEGIKDENGNIMVKGLRQYVEEYQKLNPDTEIEIQSVPFDEYLKRILISHTSGVISDVYILYSLWGVQLSDSMILDQVPKDIVEKVKSDFVRPAIDGATIDGKIWGVPIEVDNYALVFNKKLLKEAGFTNPPETWDELVEMAPKLTKRNPDGTISQYGFAFLSGWDSAVVHPYLALLYSNNGKLFEDDFSRCLLDSKEAIETLEAELKLFKNGGTDPAASVWNFPAGKVAMMIMATWYETSLKLGFKDQYEEIVGVAPIPYLKKPATAGYTWFIAVDNASKNKKQAWDFVRWLTLDKSGGYTRMGELMAKNIGSIPPNKADINFFQSELNDLYTSIFVKELEHTHQEPNVAQGQEIKTILMREIIEAWNGRKTAEKALKDAKLEIDKILSEFY